MNNNNNKFNYQNFQQENNNDFQQSNNVTPEIIFEEENNFGRQNYFNQNNDLNYNEQEIIFAENDDSQFAGFRGFSDQNYRPNNRSNYSNNYYGNNNQKNEFWQKQSYNNSIYNDDYQFNDMNSNNNYRNDVLEIIPFRNNHNHNQNYNSVNQIISTNKNKYHYTTPGNTLHVKNNLNISYSDIDPNMIEGIEVREDIKPIRVPVVKSVLMSQNYIPPLSINLEVDMTEILIQQKKLKLLSGKDHKLFTTISFIIKAISIALEYYPKLNSFYDSDSNELVIKKAHHVGLATETSDGLIIPVIKNVEHLSLKQLSLNINEVNQKLREGNLSEYDIYGSTITVVNYGLIGAVQAVPTIYYPNSAVISIGKIIRKPIVMKGDKIVVRSMMNVTVTVDQRIIDSSEAGIFLAKLQEILESPDLIVLS